MLVPVNTLDAQLASLGEGSTPILVLKVDTEGFDAHVLAGAEATLKSGRVLVVSFEYNFKVRGGGRKERWLIPCFTHVTSDRAGAVPHPDAPPPTPIPVAVSPAIHITVHGQPARGAWLRLLHDHRHPPRTPVRGVVGPPIRNMVVVKRCVLSALQRGGAGGGGGAQSGVAVSAPHRLLRRGWGRAG